MSYFLVVNREKFTLQVWKSNLLGRNWKRVSVYECAIGREGFDTPGGLYKIVKKELNPSWTPPDEAWVGKDLRDPETGKPIKITSDDPRNPLAGAFMWISPYSAIGLHGTKNLESLGTAASHGCIRLDPDVAVHLCRTIPMKSPVVII